MALFDSGVQRGKCQHSGAEQCRNRTAHILYHLYLICNAIHILRTDRTERLDYNGT